MLLRSVTKHIKEQNWFAVLVDFLIVVVGILIAFQITEWSKQRADSVRVTEILHELRTDLRSNIDIYSSALDSTLNRIAAAQYIASQAPNIAISQWEDSDEIEELERPLITYKEFFATNGELQNKDFDKRMSPLRGKLWNTLLDVFNPPSDTASFDSLINSGELGLFQNQELVSAIQDYRFWTKALAGMQDNTMRPSRNSSTEIGQLYGLSAFGKVDEKQFIDLVKNNPQLAATVQTEYGYAKRHFRAKALIKQKANALLRMIEDELGIKSGTESPKE